MRVVGIGQCSLDYLFVVDTFPAQDTKKEVLEWAVCGGGPVATALVSLARLGSHCSFHGIVGDDESGRKIEDSLRAEGIDIRGLIRRRGSVSQTAFISVEQTSGNRTIFWKRPSGVPLTPDEIPHDFLNDADFVLLDGLMMEVSLYAAREAGARNIPVMLDAGRVRKGMKELASICDYVVASEEFGQEMLGEGGSDSFDPREALQGMKSFGARACTITLGRKGSITLHGDEIFHTPSYPVETVDTTGAGDVFHGGYIYGLLQNWDIRHVVKFASAFAALKCRRLGGRSGIPRLEEVEALLQRDQA